MQNFQYKQEHCLGKGGFSDVFKVIATDHSSSDRFKNPGKVYALKKIHSHILKDPYYKATIFRQIQIMKQINHSNIIKLYEVFQTQGEISLLLQYADGGSLFDLLKIQGKFSEQLSKKYVKDIVKALKYLHNQKQPILHRDIKPENILICDKQICKLADFGCSNILDCQRKTFAGTKQYMAPEIVQNLPYNQSIDLWCLGVLIYEILVGHIPKNDINEQIEFPSHISRPAEDVIRKLLIKNPNQRMTIDQLQEHIWLAGNQEKHISEIQQSKSNKAELKLKIMRQKNNFLTQKLKQKIQGQRCKNTKLLLQKSQSSQYTEMIKYQANIQLQTENYIKMLKIKSQLKIHLEQNQKIITFKRQEFLQQISYQKEYINRLKNKIFEDSKNIQLLKKGQPKFIYECYENFQELIKKIQLLKQYVQNIPQRFLDDILTIPEIQLKKQPLPISEYIFKLKTCALQWKRDALIQLLTIKKRKKCMSQITMLNESNLQQKQIQYEKIQQI